MSTESYDEFSLSMYNLAGTIQFRNAVIWKKNSVPISSYIVHTCIKSILNNKYWSLNELT